MDFPTAWAIARETPPEHRHNDCSFNGTHGGLLCDCDVLFKHPQYIADYGSSTEGQASPTPQTRDES